MISIYNSLYSIKDFTLLINEISYEIDILDGKLHSIEVGKVLDRIGFPTNYKEIARIDEFGSHE